MERQLLALTGSFTRVQVTHFSATPCWSPAVNVYRCHDRYVVCVDLPGVPRSHISLQVEPRRVRIRGHRLPPEPRDEPRAPLQVLALEIDHGSFEREIRLPESVDPERATAEQRDGWLWIQLPLEDRP